MCVESGTGTKVAIDGYTIAGKTGTAEKYPRGNGEYLLSFIGFAPYDNPEIVCYVVLDNPVVEGKQSTAQVMEIWKSIMEEVLPYMDIFSESQQIEDTTDDEVIDSVFDEQAQDEMNDAAGVENDKEDEAPNDNSEDNNSEDDNSDDDNSDDDEGQSTT
jgi:stage V sporulation protein D (sporulation-specific penicillin-binding protein)